jgi:hypothetical protein
MLARIVVALMLLSSGGAAAATKADLEAQLKLLMAWLPGDYDNNEQIVRQSGGGLSKPVHEPVPRIHSRFRAVDAPQFGRHVVYLEEFRNNDPRQVTRIRLYTFAVDEARGAIRMKLLNPVDQKTLVGADGDMSRISKLSEADVKPDRDNCIVWLRWVGGQFEGTMTPRLCDRGNEWVDYHLVIGPRYHWVKSKMRKLKGDALASEMTPGDTWLEQTKARWFSCTVNRNADGDMTKTSYFTTVRLHDQGGEADIAWPDGRTLTFVIHTRAFTSPTEREFPLFRIHEKGNHVPIAYAYAADDAERFGLNLGWFYTLCYVKGQEPPVPTGARQ